ncbi:hypothetical protein [Sporosarcina sp. A2]|uniref:hypothetical protein n=1 Tax=Sporosarcina sp. A2 TaxID=3393449 RepID=UPI003D792A6A
MNFENDAALGLSATETTRNSAATDLYGKSFKKLSEAQKQLTLLKMVEDANKVSGAMGQAARESDGLENVLGNMKQSWTDLKAAVGQPLLEVATEGIKGLTGVLQNIDGEKMAASITAIFTTIGVAFDFIKSHPAIVWMQNNLPAVFEQVSVALQSAFSTDSVGAAIEGITSFLGKMQDVSQQLWDFFLQMAPGVTIVFQDLWDILQPIFIALGTAFSVIGDIVGTVFNTIVLPLLKLVWGTFQILWGIVSPILKLLAAAIQITFSYLETIWNNYVKPILGWIGDKFEEASERAKPALEAISKFLDGLRDSIDTVMSRVTDLTDTFKNIKPPDWLVKGASAVGDFFIPTSADGSHATGLASVPFNGYLAETHVGESILTANQSNTLRGMGVLKSSGDKPVIDTSSLSGRKTISGKKTDNSIPSSSPISIGSIQVIGHNKPTKEIAREIVDEVNLAIGNGALAGVH